MSQQRTAPASPPKAQDPASTVMALVESQKAQILRALPKHMNHDRMVRIVFTELRKNPELAKCDQMSFLGAVIQSAQLGLEPGSGLGHSYLIPFNNRSKGIVEAQFIVGYRGLIDLARRSGQVETISARIVREKDYFEYEYGDDERIRHKPFEGPDEEAGRITHAYAIARLRGGGIQREVMTRAQIDRIMNGKKSVNPVWETHFDEMARKTVVRRLAKYLPLSPELAIAIEKDDAQYSGDSQENWRTIDVSYEPRPSAHDPEKIVSQQNAPSNAHPNQREAQAADADLEVARGELRAAMNLLLDAGGDPGVVLGEDPEQLLRDADPKTLQNRADILTGALPKEQRPGASSPRPIENHADRRRLLEASLRGRRVPPADWSGLIAKLGERPNEELRGIVDAYFAARETPR